MKTNDSKMKVCSLYWRAWSRLRRGSVLALTLYGLSVSLAPAAPLDTAFTYQGRLTAAGGLPVNGPFDLRLALYDRPETNLATQIGPMLTRSNVFVANGLFTITLDFGPVFNGTPYWLEIEVRPLIDPEFRRILPRQPIIAAPYALYAINASNAVIAATAMHALNATTATNAITANSIEWNNIISRPPGLDDGDNNTTYSAGEGLILNAGQFAIDSSVARFTNVWRLGGNSNAIPGVHFIGTTDDAALEFKVKNGRALRLQPGTTSPSTVGGYPNNFIPPSIDGATIAGGGASNMINVVSNSFGSIAGGRNNTVLGQSASIGGGSGNTASGQYAIIPGGADNTATNYAFAAGRRAKANHPGAFVWGDSLDADVASTTNDQFTVRALNGVRLTRDAGAVKATGIGEFYRDNAVIAWGRVNTNGILQADFGVESVAHPSIGVYDITLNAIAANAFQLVPMATAAVASPPSDVATARLVTVNQTGPQTFTVYINNGNYSLTNNNFVFIVTGR